MAGRETCADASCPGTLGVMTTITEPQRSAWPIRRLFVGLVVLVAAAAVYQSTISSGQAFPYHGSQAASFLRDHGGGPPTAAHR
jgi:hypothetical protein